MKEWIATIPVTESFMVLANIPKSKFSRGFASLGLLLWDFAPK